MLLRAEPPAAAHVCHIFTFKCSGYPPLFRYQRTIPHSATLEQERLYFLSALSSLPHSLSNSPAHSRTCYLGFNLALHLQRVHEDAPVADEAGAGDAPVGLAEALLVELIPKTHG